ncbi:hypothetical protein HK097_002455 [Rhizophlyctis rosea]|uniref:Large-conductance mechanosensitive channel n=1 Tax=Rhizophlyctis rosea TaxID=64517 RepID=A0AAD5SGK3_9FUNG|nr:hypothetical protein HK097_002455 [Rhizophlyctis rosea]
MPTVNVIELKDFKNGATKGTKAIGGVLNDFKAFLNKGNVVDLAVGIVMGAAFTSIVTSLVSDIITPVIGLAIQANLANKFVIMRCPFVNGTTTQSDCWNTHNWNTTVDAQKAGAVTWNWGNFLQTLINFVIIAAIVFLIVKFYAAAFRREEPPKKTKECPYCFKDVPKQATRCPECTSQLEAVPERSPSPDTIMIEVKKD